MPQLSFAAIVYLNARLLEAWRPLCFANTAITGVPMYRYSRAAQPHSRYSDLYAMLGISPDASPEEIQAAYRVLENAYRPDGTYADDVMHQAFLEITDAATILGNARTRKLYDRGYIDATGRPTPAGVARAARGRRAAIVSCALAAAIAGLLIVKFSGEAPEANHSSVEAGPPPQKIAAAEPPPAAASPLHEPAAKTEANGAASESPSSSAPSQANAQAYMPPADALKPQSKSASTPSQPIQEPSNLRRRSDRHNSRAAGSTAESPRLAQSAERNSEAGAAAPNIWERDIWFRDRLHRGDSEASDSPALKSAQCLACLTSSRANCSKTCP